jgi:uncharacterized membrane protein
MSRTPSALRDTLSESPPEVNVQEGGAVLYLLAFLIGVVAGLRAMTAPAAVSWAARLGSLDLGGSWLSFLGHAWTPWILSFLALGELVNDKRPSTPSRTVPPQFGARIVTGALSGAAIGVSGGSLVGGLVAGALGAVAGTLGGRDLRARMAKAFGGDLPAALAEDAIAIGGALLIAWVL